MNIPIAKIKVSKKGLKNVQKVLRSGWLVQGKNVFLLENLWKKYTGSKYCVVVNSCTSALIVALKALDLKTGDEVIVPSFTWISTANAPYLLGAKVKFCDISLKDYNLDISKLKKIISKKTKFIIAVHLFGIPANMDKIKLISKKNNIKVIEDAACGHGTFIRKKHVGNFSSAGCFSFHARKIITTGEGGAITTNNKKFYKKCLELRDHGALVNDYFRHNSKKPYFMSDHAEAGYNFRMTDIQASIGLSQIKDIGKILSHRKKIAKKYDIGLSKIKWLKRVEIPKSYKNSYQSYVLRVEKYKNQIKDEKLRNNLMIFLQSRGISTRPGTHAIHELAFYKKQNSNDLKKSSLAYKTSISLPIYNSMNIKETNQVIKNILEYQKK